MSIFSRISRVFRKPKPINPATMRVKLDDHVLSKYTESPSPHTRTYTRYIHRVIDALKKGMWNENGIYYCGQWYYSECFDPFELSSNPTDTFTFSSRKVPR